ncbi:TPA: single-stranded DNA-binding protein, partial [Candidatus Saccharibacteria bacterium]|nr:single-stranded DNA-binding protein [Candidatus Saccharibacteria bacterium]
SYIDCVAWGKPGEIIAQYLGKGRAVLVSGRLDQRSWEDKESGGKRSKIEVVVEDFNFVGDGAGAPSGGSSSSSSSSSSNKSASNDSPAIDDKPIDLSEIPF